MALSDIGESDIIYCSTCKYAADQEKAESNPTLVNYNDSMLDVEEVETIVTGLISMDFTDKQIEQMLNERDLKKIS